MTGTGSLNTVDVHMIWGEERKKTKQALEKEGVEGGGEGEEVKWNTHCVLLMVAQISINITLSCLSSQITFLEAHLSIIISIFNFQPIHEMNRYDFYVSRIISQSYPIPFSTVVPLRCHCVRLVHMNSSSNTT